MRGKLKLLVLTVSFLLFVNGAFALSLKVKNIRYEPYPAEPGRYLDVWVKIQNTGEEIDNLTVKMPSNYPFLLAEEEEAVNNIGELWEGQQVVVHYKFRVDEEAVEGENELEFKYADCSGKCENWVTKPFQVMVKTRDAILKVNEVFSKGFEPGSTSQVTFELENMADSLLKNVRFNLNLTGIIPFSPVRGTSSKALESLGPGEVTNVSFKLRASSEASTGVYKLPFLLSYADELGKVYSRRGVTGLTIGGESDLDVELGEVGKLRKGDSGTFSVYIANRGEVKARFLKVSLGEGKGYEVLSQRHVYIGNIDSDGYETVEYKIHVNSSKDPEVPLILDYKNWEGENFEVDRSLELEVYNQAEIRKLELGEERNWLPYVVIGIGLVAAAYGIYWIRRNKKDILEE